ncbi:MAG: Nif3-like dinuclear metal center hexameric protein [Candidatus Izemoplasmatales bacterium]|jgi:dinuclear metal center YbgI/SA1388 family protein|nr:Nif3-like dinuclear metal center hexameric protein [Candidatus Izemoplasmatales bacterium]NLF49269.1 Nif3-like dinuclear metal center hexameric protein [Acholeplasmataceae bacterium]MDD4354891.1 Nif3-like dinuclear metal center hexameric protein [Candidatus Izemoplasmatales bacterium]MDD4987669.1 Nif3-like dinuclear metal center hexameric protein [Candidatus Izemoplasmatales bacterium]MDD5601362.1 Nif3-like dinuclear metal center hexameric protein [Candidatus Izemoplasmatales bacterium]
MNRIDVTKFLDELYPRSLAYDWDNVGLQIGTLNKPLQRILVTLDVTKEVVKEAIDTRVDLLISHHPLIFHPISNIAFDTPRGWIIRRLIKHDIALFSMHTNFDRATGGMNDALAEKLGMRNTSLLDPDDDIGRIGEIDPIPFPELLVKIKNTLELDHVRTIGYTEKVIKKIGISGGSGERHLYHAKRQGCDIYLTGDITYHTALDAQEMGFIVVDIGHYAEKVFKEVVLKILKREFPEIEVLESQVNTSPYRII